MKENKYEMMEDEKQAIKLAIEAIAERGEEPAKEYLLYIIDYDCSLLKDFAAGYNNEENLKTALYALEIEPDELLNLPCNNLQEYAESGCQWAFDFLEKDGWIEDNFDCNTWDSLFEFLAKCDVSGVDIGDYSESLVNAMSYGEYEFLIDIYTKRGAFEALIDFDLTSYSWLEDYLDGNDALTKIVEENIDRIFKDKKDINWLQRNANDNVPQAQYLMALLYLSNSYRIVKANKTLAQRYLKAAKEGGCKLAEDVIQSLEVEELVEQKKAQQQKMEALTKANALESEIQRAENGELSLDRTVQLAAWLSAGNKQEGVKKNANRANKLYRLAIKQGDSEAMYRYGLRLIDGEGCRKNWNAGMSYMRKAAKSKHKKAMDYVEHNDFFLNRLIHKIIK